MFRYLFERNSDQLALLRLRFREQFRHGILARRFANSEPPIKRLAGSLYLFTPDLTRGLDARVG